MTLSSLSFAFTFYAIYQRKNEKFAFHSTSLERRQEAKKLFPPFFFFLFLFFLFLPILLHSIDNSPTDNRYRVTQARFFAPWNALWHFPECVVLRKEPFSLVPLFLFLLFLQIHPWSRNFSSLVFFILFFIRQLHSRSGNFQFQW